MLQPLQLTVRQCCDFLPAIHLISLDTERDGYRTNFHPALLQSLSGMEDPGRHSCWWILPKYGGGWLFWFVLCCFVLFCLVYFVFHKVHCLFLFSPLVTARMWLIDNLLWIYHALTSWNGCTCVQYKITEREGNTVNFNAYVYING